MLSLLKDYKIISIIGMEKNVGKTTTLNHIINQTKGEISLGLTSIGRDGESVDRVTATSKPRIYVSSGTIIATARQCLSDFDITKEILAKLNIMTPMGEIIVVRALSDGYVEIAGPSITKDLEKVADKMLTLGAEKVFLDGALSRKSLASPGVAEATILATGAAVSKSIKEVVDKTVHAYNLLKIDEVEEKIKNCIDKVENKAAIIKNINQELIVEEHDITTSLSIESSFFNYIDEKTTHIYLKGAITEKVANALIKFWDGNKNISLIVEDGTKLFIKDDTLNKMKLKKISLMCHKKINVVAVTLNPTSPFGYSFKSDLFKKMLGDKLDIPVVNVLEL